jgi:serine/threonine protein kinase
MPSDPAALYQMASGLLYIHSNNLVHRDLSTGNVLIALNGDQEALLKISDFGFCKPASDTGSFSMSQGSKGTKRFVAPEMLKLMDVKGEKPRGRASSDIFSMGCLFFTYLTKGGHPFSDGSVHTIPLNVLDNKQFLEGNLLNSFYIHFCSNRLKSDFVFLYF